MEKLIPQTPDDDALANPVTTLTTASTLLKLPLEFDYLDERGRIINQQLKNCVRRAFWAPIFQIFELLVFGIYPKLPKSTQKTSPFPYKSAVPNAENARLNRPLTWWKKTPKLTLAPNFYPNSNPPTAIGTKFEPTEEIIPTTPTVTEIGVSSTGIAKVRVKITGVLVQAEAVKCQVKCQVPWILAGTRFATTPRRTRRVATLGIQAMPDLLLGVLGTHQWSRKLMSIQLAFLGLVRRLPECLDRVNPNQQLRLNPHRLTRLLKLLRAKSGPLRVRPKKVICQAIFKFFQFFWPKRLKLKSRPVSLSEFILN